MQINYLDQRETKPNLEKCILYVVGIALPFSINLFSRSERVRALLHSSKAFPYRFNLQGLENLAAEHITFHFGEDDCLQKVEAKTNNGLLLLSFTFVTCSIDLAPSKDNVADPSNSQSICEALELTKEWH